MKLSFPNLRTRRGASMLLITILVLELLTYGSITYVKSSHTTSVNNLAGSATMPTKSALTTKNADAARDATITVPCGCKKQISGQPGQASTAGTVLQGGAPGSVQMPNCLPCQETGTGSTATICPEFACRAPSPTPPPTPSPSPTPPQCTPCGFREGATTSPGYMCPMLCAQ